MSEPSFAAPRSPADEDAASARDLVSVVVPARDEERSIGACIEAILAQTHSNLEVLVVDGASRDGTAVVVEGHRARDRRVRLLRNDRATIPTSLNVALAAASGRWLVRVDAHSTVPADYVRRAVERLRTGRWGGVGGRKDGVARTPAGRAIAAALGSPFGVGNSTYHHGTRAGAVDHVPFGAYPTALLRELGGWDERLLANEDYELDFRLRASGFDLLFDPELRIDWQTRETIRALFAQYRRYGRGKADVARLHPSSLRPRHLAAPALVATLGAAAALSPVRPRLAATPFGAYALVVLIAAAVTARRVDRAARPWIAPAFVAMHVGWGVGFWEGVARGARFGARAR